VLVRPVHRVGNGHLDDREWRDMADDGRMPGDRPGEELGIQPGFFSHFPQCGLGGRFTGLDVTAW